MIHKKYDPWDLELYAVYGHAEEPLFMDILGNVVNRDCYIIVPNYDFDKYIEDYYKI
jgi:hypothetical protein